MTQENYATELGKSFREQRQGLHLSLADVAEAMGVSVNSVRNWERGLSSISSYNDRRLRAYFKVRRDAAALAAQAKASGSPQGKQVTA